MIRHHAKLAWTLGSIAAGCLALGLLDGCLVGDEDGDATGEPPPNADPQAGCSLGCHGDGSSAAPPNNLKGETMTNLRTVGAHRVHLDPASTWHRKVACADCHTVPDTVSAPGHMDGDGVAELTFAGVAVANGAQPVWNGDTCANAYCHGSAALGGAAIEPTWTLVDGSQAQCGSCHSLPPPAPHPPGTDCGSCHPTVQPGSSMTFLDPDSHINGKVDLAATGDGACDSCHGGGGVAAPPKALNGSTDRATAAVGAHRVHLTASTSYRTVACSQCHTVPVTQAAPGHIDGDNKAELTFDALNPGATYSAADATCQNLYCHGDGWSVRGTMVWTSQTPVACGSCHSINRNGTRRMSGDHNKHLGEGVRCSQCHSTVVDQAMGIINANLHVNGVHEVVFQRGGTFDPATRTCTGTGNGCHGNRTERW